MNFAYSNSFPGDHWLIRLIGWVVFEAFQELERQLRSALWRITQKKAGLLADVLDGVKTEAL